MSLLEMKDWIQGGESIYYKRTMMEKVEITKTNLFENFMQCAIQELNEEDKIDFARYFVRNVIHIDDSIGRVQIGDMDINTLRFFIYAIVSSYDHWKISQLLDP